ncbi:CHAT domain-containing protein [Spirosoma luteolum]
MSSLATFYSARYRPDSAQYCFRRADALLIQNPRIETEIPLYVLYHFNNQGNWFFRLGNYTRSLVVLTKAQTIANRFALTDEVAYIESNVAGCYNTMGQHEKALIHMRRAAALNITDRVRWRYTLGIGWTLHALDRPAEALQYLRQADRQLVRLRRQAADHVPDQIMVWRMMSNCYRLANRPDKAEQYASRAVDLHRRYLGRHGGGLAQALLEVGQNYEYRRQLSPALQSYQDAILAVCQDTARPGVLAYNPPLASATDETILLSAAVRKARALKQLYVLTHNRAHLQASAATYRYCVELQQRIRHGIDADQAQLVFSEQQHRLVPDALATTMELYELHRSSSLRETLFSLFEQSQAASLREALQQQMSQARAIPTRLLEQEHRLNQQIRALQRRMPAESLGAAELNALELQRHRLIETFRQDFPAYYQLSYQPNVISTRSLQKQLGEQTAYLAYVRQATSLFILVVTAQQVAVVRQPIDSSRFEQALTALKGELYQDPLLRQYKGAPYATFLYAACIEPVRAYLVDKTRLVISRDLSLQALPFEVLETGWRARDYLARRVSIAYASSAQSFFAAREQLSGSRPTLVVAPFGQAGVEGGSAGEWGALPSSEAEARQIGGELLLGPRASLPALLETPLDRPVVYFATHAQADDSDPANAYLVLYPGKTADRLYADDICNLPLAATGLAVLGACEAGSGRTVKGDGILSIARAFLYAGCPAVVTTLWKANSRTTSFLTLRLHRYLKQGYTIDRALQQARLDFFASPLAAKFDHPYYWANYILLGNYRPVMAQPSPWLSDWWVVGLATSVLAGWVWKRHRPLPTVAR